MRGSGGDFRAVSPELAAADWPKAEDVCNTRGGRRWCEGVLVCEIE